MVVVSGDVANSLAVSVDITDLILMRCEAIALQLRALDLHFQRFGERNELRRALGLDERLARR